LKPLKRVTRVNVEVADEEPMSIDEPNEPEVTLEPVPEEPEKKVTKKRKRRAHEEEEKVEDIESRYLNKVYSKISKLEPVEETAETTETPLSVEIDDELLQHETVTSTSNNAEKTIFISNLPVKVLTSKPLLKSLKQLFLNHGQINSVRFRSIAFTELVPRKVAYITKSFHPERDSLNAYLVYNEEGSVKSAVDELNGFLWEGKHLRVDSVSNPSVTPLCIRG
jgi:nucleolar protein 12